MKSPRGVVARALGAALAVLMASATLTVASVAVETPAALAADLSQFQAGDIIDDTTFFNSSTMSVADIQTFLEAKVPSCASTCLRNFSGPSQDLAATPMCTAYTGKASETAAQMIYNSAVQCGINPQVILVVLQKEQGLITASNPSSGAFAAAMGAGCPDTGGCDPGYSGLFAQIHYGTYLMKRYTQPAGTGAGTDYPSRFDLSYPVGQTTGILLAPSPCTTRKSVFVANQATHVLYTYTPYTPSDAVLAAGYGSVPGDSCATYGNRNFYQFFSDWFGTGRASVSGTVTGEGTGSLAGVVVRAHTSGGTVAGTSYTVASGGYTLSHLPAGSYSIEFDRGPNTDFSQGSPASVTVAAGAAATGVNAVLAHPTFADVDPSNPFYADVQWMAAQGISTGTPQPSGKPLYKPADAVSRQAMAAFLLKLSGQTFSAPTDPTFADVDQANPFYSAIEWMAAQGISSGTPQPSGKPLYKPADPVSRQAMATFLARYHHVDTTTPPATPSFADVPIDAPPAAAIAWMASSGISAGTPQPSGLPLYKPADPVSRQAMAAFLHRLALLP